MIVKYSYPIWKDGKEREIQIHPDCLNGAFRSVKYFDHLKKIILNREIQIFMRRTFMIEVYKDEFEALKTNGCTIVYDVRVFKYSSYTLKFREMQFWVWTDSHSRRFKKLKRFIDIDDIVSFSFDQYLDKRRMGRFIAGPVAQIWERSIMQDTLVGKF